MQAGTQPTKSHREPALRFARWKDPEVSLLSHCTGDQVTIVTIMEYV